MKKAVVLSTCKINRVTYLRGATFFEPYPPGFQREIEEKSGLIAEVDDKAVSTAAGAVKPAQKKDAADKDKGASTKDQEAKQKKARVAYAFEKFGVKIDGRKPPEVIEQIIAELEEKHKEGGEKSDEAAASESAQGEGAPAESDESASQDDAAGQGEQDIDNL